MTDSSAKPGTTPARPEHQALTPPTPHSQEPTSAAGTQSPAAGQAPTSKTTTTIAVLAVVFANIAGILGSVEKIQESLQKIFGSQWSPAVRDTSIALLAGLLLIGYSILGYVVYKWAQRRGRRAGLITAMLAVPLVLGVFGFNYITIKPEEPTWSVVADTTLARWTTEGFSLVKENGGFRDNLANPASHSQVWNTAQYLTGILSTGRELTDEQHIAIKRAFQYIESQRNRDDDGWGIRDGNTTSMTEIGAWVTLAYVQALDYDGADRIWKGVERDTVRLRLRRNLAYLVKRQHREGGFSVFTNLSCPRTYSTMMAIWALTEARRQSVTRDLVTPAHDVAIRNGTRWLLQTYDDSLGWRTFERAPRDRVHTGLTAQTAYVTLLVADQFPEFRPHTKLQHAVNKVLSDRSLERRDITVNTQVGDSETYECDPTGQITFEKSTFLWYPWSLALASYAASDAHIAGDIRTKAEATQGYLIRRMREFERFAASTYAWVAAEGTVAFSIMRLTDAG